MPISCECVSVCGLRRALCAYHFQPLLHRSSPLQVLGSGLDVPVDGLLGQIDHVGGEKRLAVFLEVGLICVHHTIEPRKQLLCAVVGM